MSKLLRCAIYTRVSTEHGLEQEFNSLDNQREAAEAYVKSQSHEGWRCLPARYDDGGFSGGSLERPALQTLLADIQARRIDVVVVYKVDRLTRSLADFAKLVELFDGHGVSFVSVTQAFNTTTSMGRLTLNVLLSFAQFVKSSNTRSWCAGSMPRPLSDPETRTRPSRLSPWIVMAGGREGPLYLAALSMRLPKTCSRASWSETTLGS